jgi:hypothetical protein
MKKHLLFSILCFCSVYFSQNISAQNGTCIPVILLDCVTAPKYIDSVWTTNANIDFNNWGTGCNTQDQNYMDYFTSRRAYVYYPGSFDLHIALNPANAAYIGVWIDWNDDLVFGAGEQVYLSSSQISSVAINIPYPNINDTVVMRVRSGSTSMGACDTVNAGETEDYGLVVFPSVQGIAPNPTTLAWTIFPNPANDFLNISLAENSGETEISILDLLGNVIESEKINSGNSTLDLSALPHGMYFVKVVSNGKSGMKKFVH